jgi:hypothetical protein
MAFFLALKQHNKIKEKNENVFESLVSTIDSKYYHRFSLKSLPFKIRTNMVAKTLVAAVFAAYVAAGPCKPKSLPSDIFSSTDPTIEPTTVVETTTSGQTTTQSEEGSTTESTIINSLITTSFERSTQTTEAASITTSGGPTGEDIILQVNPQRRLAKRDTTFVGNSNPTSCDLAMVFGFSSEQFLQDGVPIYYQGEGYQELAAQGTPPADAVTKAFAITQGYLSWTNAAFGEAAFCQTPSDGKVYITFTSKPTGCQSVTLTAYKRMREPLNHKNTADTKTQRVNARTDRLWTKRLLVPRALWLE